MNKLIYLFILVLNIGYSQDLKKVNGVTDTNVKKVATVSDTNIKKVNGVTLSTFTGILDNYPGAGAAWSVRKLRSGYSGDCMRVRRSSDNTEQDIGFEADGDLDVGAITTFCGAGNGHVVTLYDQSSNGYDLTVASASWRICSSGSITVADNGKPALTYVSNIPLTSSIDVADVFGNSVFYHYSVGSVLSDINGGIVYTIDAPPGYIYTMSDGFFGFVRYDYSLLCVSTSTIPNPDQTFIVECAMQSSSVIDLYIDNVETGNIEVVDTNNPTGTYTISVGTDGSANMKTFQELILYPSDQNSNRSSIYANIAAYF